MCKVWNSSKNNNNTAYIQTCNIRMVYNCSQLSKVFWHLLVFGPMDPSTTLQLLFPLNSFYSRRISGCWQIRVSSSTLYQRVFHGRYTVQCNIQQLFMQLHRINLVYTQGLSSHSCNGDEQCPYSRSLLGNLQGTPLFLIATHTILLIYPVLCFMSSATILTLATHLSHHFQFIQDPAQAEALEKISYILSHTCSGHRA